MARLAICESLAAQEKPPGLFVTPLLSLLDDPDVRLQDAANVALDAIRDGNVVVALEQLARDPAAPFSRRVAAIRALPNLRDVQPAGEALIRILELPQSRLRSEATAALVRLTGVDYESDATQWREWWKAEHGQLASCLNRKLRETERSHSHLENQYMKVLDEALTRVPAEARDARLLECLESPLAADRRTALRLLGKNLVEGKTPSDALAAATRKLLTDPDPRVRREVVLVLRDLRQASDGEVLLQHVKQERDRIVKPVLYNAIGRLGTAGAITLCIAALDDDDDEVVAEATTALGFLVQQHRSTAAADISLAIDAVIRRFSPLPTEPTMRGLVVDTLARMRDPRLAPILDAEAAESEPVASIRLAAVSGLEYVGNESSATVVAARLTDGDAGVREAAAQTLGAIGSSRSHLDALAARLDPNAEPIKTVQARIWEGYRSVFSRLSVNDALAVLTRFDSGRDAVAAERFVQLAAAAGPALSALRPVPPDAIDVLIRACKAMVQLDRHAEAASALERLLPLLASAPAAQQQELTLMAIRANLGAARYEQAVAIITSPGGAALPGEAVATLTLEHVRSLLAAELPDAAIQCVESLRPTASRFSDQAWAKFDKLETDAYTLQRKKDRENVQKWIADLGAGGDAAANASVMIKKLGPRAVHLLRGELERLVRTTPANKVVELAIIGLLKELAPSWAGYDPDGPPEEKMKALRALAKPA
jgi:HEAT repeat protein